MQKQFYFRDMKAANQAVEKLKEIGVEKAFVDINDHYDDDRNVETNNPGTEMSTSLSGLVLESDSDGIIRDKAALNTASPMVSGMGRFEEIAGVACSVFAEADDANMSRIEQVVKELGGTADNPNITKPKPRNDGQLTAYQAAEETREV